MQNKIEQVAELLLSSAFGIAFTGAGISTASGIPDFRGPSGLWKKYPQEFASIEYFRTDPRGFWEFYSTRMKGLFLAEPNAAHYALAELEKLGLIKSVITQNIDGLHQKAGSKIVIELHGTMRRCYCSTCYKQYDSSEVLQKISQGENPPKCECGGVIRPDVVLFGEPVTKFNEAVELAMEADLVLALGSSLTVYPANMIPQIVKQRRGRLIIINNEETPLDVIADVIINDSVEKVLPEIVNVVKTMVNR